MPGENRIGFTEFREKWIVAPEFMCEGRRNKVRLLILAKAGKGIREISKKYSRSIKV